LVELNNAQFCEVWKLRRKAYPFFAAFVNASNARELQIVPPQVPTATFLSGVRQGKKPPVWLLPTDFQGCPKFNRFDPEAGPPRPLPLEK
jgi:hypothetical protein